MTYKRVGSSWGQFSSNLLSQYLCLIREVTFGVKGLSGDYCIHMIEKGDLWCEGTLSEWGLLYTHDKEGLPLV